MSLITWNDSMSVKVKKFDDQHKKLVELINALHDAMREGRGAALLGDVLKSLAIYTHTHFAAEEQLMKQHAYPGYELHRAEHNKLLKQVEDLQAQLNAGRAPITQAVMQFLKDWLVNHIQAEDKRYSAHLNGKGVS